MAEKVNSLMTPALNTLIKNQSRMEGIKQDDISRIILGEEPEPEPEPESEPESIIQDTPKKKRLTDKIVDYIEKRHHETHALPSWVKKLIKVSSLVLFIVSVSISSIFSFQYFNERNGWLVAVLFCILVVGSSNLLQTIGFKIMFRSFKSFFIGIVLLVIGFTSMLFSMTNTVSALYNGRSKTVVEVAAAQENAEEYELLKQNYQIALKAYQDADRDVTELQDTLSGLDITSKEYNTQRTRLYNAKNYRDELKEKSDAAFTIMQEKRLTVTQSRDTFEVFIAKNIGFDGEQVEFGLGLFPAISADLIAPITLMIFMFF